MFVAKQSISFVAYSLRRAPLFSSDCVGEVFDCVGEVSDCIQEMSSDRVHDLSLHPLFPQLSLCFPFHETPSHRTPIPPQSASALAMPFSASCTDCASPEDRCNALHRAVLENGRCTRSRQRGGGVSLSSRSIALYTPRDPSLSGGCVIASMSYPSAHSTEANRETPLETGVSLCALVECPASSTHHFITPRLPSSTPPWTLRLAR